MQNHLTFSALKPIFRSIYQTRSVFCTGLYGAVIALLSVSMCVPSVRAQEEKKKDPATEQYFRANTLYQRKLYEFAAKEYNAFLKTNPEHEKVPSAQFGLSLSYLGMGKFDLAEPLLAKLAANKKAPNQEYVHLFWGQALLRLKNNAKAETAYREGLKLPGAAKNVRMKIGLLEALFAQKKWKDVIPSADDLGNIKGDWTTRANFQGAIARYELNNFKETTTVLEGLKDALKGSPFEQQAYYLLAESHRELKDYKKAVDAYENAARKLKGQYAAEALFRLGIVRFDRLKAYDKAATDFGEFRINYKKDPRSIEAGVYLGRSHLENDKLKEDQRFQMAENVFSELANDSKAVVDVPLWQARTFFRQQKVAKHKEAVDVLVKAVAKFTDSPKLPDLLFELGKNHYVLENYSETAETMSRLISNHAEFRQLDDVLRLNADALHFDKKYAASKKLCEQYLGKYGNEAEAGNVAWLLGENLFLLENYDEAIAGFQNFITAHASHALVSSAKFRIGNSHYNQEKWPAALTVLEPLTQDAQVAKKFIQIHFLVGQCYFHTKAWAKAVQNFEKFVKDHPKTPNADTALLFSGLASRQNKASSVAISTFGKLRQEYVSSKHMARTLVEIGTLQYETKEMAKARQALEEVAEKHPESKWRANAEYILGFVSRGENKPDEAIQHFALVANNKGHELAPDARFQQGVLLLQKKDFVEAEKTFKQLLAASSDYKKTDEATYSLGQALERQEKWDEALVEYGKVNGFEKSEWRDNALYQSAWCELGADRQVKAIETYGKLLSDFSGSDLFNLASWELAELEFKVEKYPAAIARMQSVLGKSKGDEEALLRSRIQYRMAWSYFEMKNYTKAAEVYEAFDESLPANPPADLKELTGTAAYQAGESRMEVAEASADKPSKEGEYKAALVNYQKSISTKTGGDVVQSQSRLQLGKAQGLLQDWAASQKTYEDFIQAYPEHRLIRDAWYGLGWAQKGQQAHAGAIESFANVIKGSKKDELGARTVYHLGDCHYQIAKASKNDDEIQASCTESIIIFADLGANYPEELGSPKGVWQARALLGTGMALELAGKEDDARKQYQNLVQKYPDSNAAAIAKGKLN